MIDVDVLEEAIHSVERPTKVRVLCEVCRPKAEAIAKAYAAEVSERAEIAREYPDLFPTPDPEGNLTITVDAAGFIASIATTEDSDA